MSASQDWKACGFSHVWLWHPVRTFLLLCLYSLITENLAEQTGLFILKPPSVTIMAEQKGTSQWWLVQMTENFCLRKLKFSFMESSNQSSPPWKVGFIPNLEDISRKTYRNHPLRRCCWLRSVLNCVCMLKIWSNWKISVSAWKEALLQHKILILWIYSSNHTCGVFVG